MLSIVLLVGVFGGVLGLSLLLVLVGGLAAFSRALRVEPA
jgi:hypothetical protein